MPQALVQIGVQVIGQRSIAFVPIDRLLVVHELLSKTAPFRRLFISIGNVSDRHRLGTVVATNPVGVRQVDSDRRRRITIPTQHSCRNHFGRDTFYLFFTELRIDR